MSAGRARFGYFVSKDQTTQDADNVCVLVVHYDFKDAKTQLQELTQLEIKKDLIRDGDDTDVKNLDETFGKNRNCNFRSILSPEKGKLLQFLSDREKLLQEFGCSDVPSVFVLYILSHGDRDGLILTDYVKDDVRKIVDERRDGHLHLSELFVSFTTTDVFESLKNLTGFDECLKLINFGSCRGELKDTIFPAIVDNFNNANSCRITYSPLTRNTVVFFSTVETTLANRDPATGTTFIHLTCKVLNSLEKDESLINVLTYIQNEIHKDSVKGTAGQTPEVKMFSQDRSFVFSKSPRDSSKSDAMSIKREFYSWKSSTGENMRRRLALLFSAVTEGNKQLNEVQTALSQNLDFETIKLKLSGKAWTSINEGSSWRDFDIGCIFLIFFGLVTKNLETNEVCVQVDGRETAVSEILREFIGPKNDQWIGKPKILFLLNQETSSSADASGFIQPYMRISATNHSGWLVLVLHNKDDLQKLIEIFNGQKVKTEKSLQEHLGNLLISESKENRDFLNSTLQYPLNFPDWPSSFVQLSFSVTNSQKNKEYDVSFDSLVNKSAKEKQIWLLSSVAGTGKTTVLREMAFQLGKLNPQFQILRVSLPRVPFSSLDRNVTEIEFLVKATQNSKEEIIKSIEHKQCVVILDGFDEIIRPDNQEKTLKVIEALEKKQISVWIGTRPNAAEAIKNRISKAVIVKIDPLKKKQQMELFQLETGKSRDDWEDFLKKMTSKDILRNPLHLSLVAKYGAKGNLYQIYDKVVRHKVKDTLIRKAVDKNKEADFGEILAIAILDLQKLASNHFRGVELPDYVKDDLEKNNYYGIASFQNNHGFFIHQTFAEFLAAQHFLREIENSGDCDIQSSTENIADLFLGESFSWCRKFVDLFYSTVLNDAEKIEKRRASILRVMKLDPDNFLGLIASDGCINIFKMVYPIITFSENQVGDRITVAKDRTLLFKAIKGAEEIAIMLLDTDLINSDDELLIILPHLLNLVAESNACLFFEKLETKFPRLPEMIHSRRSIIAAGVLAARKNHCEILHLLLQNGVDKDFQGDEGSALYLAIWNGDIKCVEVLLKHGAKLAIDEDGESWDPLMMAVEENDLDLVKLLVEENISGLQRNKETFEINEVESELNVLHLAIQEGFIEIAKFLIEKSPGLKNVENGDDESLLQFSAKNGNYEMCQWLIDEGGVDVNTLRRSGDPRDWSRNDEDTSDGSSDDEDTSDGSSDDEDTSDGSSDVEDDNICMDYFLLLQKSDINMTDERGKTALHCAAERGYLERVQELVNAGANIQAVDENGWNAFHFACSSVRYFDDDDEMNEIHDITVQIIQKLHSTDSQLAKEKTGRGQTGLHIHLKFSYCSVKVTRFLVEEIGVDVKAKDNNGCTALRIAVNEAKDSVDYLMEKDIDLEVKTKRGRTCLHFAAERGDLDALQTWIELGGDFNVVDEKGMTALHIAAENGHLQFVKKFLVCATEEVQNQDLGEGCVGSKLKERLNRCDNEGRTALQLAAESGNVDLVKLLLENNADLTHADKVGRTPLHLAAESGNVDLVEWLLKNNADLTQMDMKGKNAIHYAIENERMLRFLNEKNGDLVKQRTKYGDTTLHLALKRNGGVTEEIALWIIGQVDDDVLNAKNDSGETPLLLACRNGWCRAAELLLSRNVEVNVSDANGKTAMHYAAEYVNLYLLKLLHEKGVDLTLRDNKGMNALHHAAEKGNLSLVKLLHEKGVDLTLTDNQGMNALHHALENFEVVLFLHEKNNELLGQRLQNGDTALHFALKTWDIDTDIIRWLVEQCEIDLNVTNSEGETPLMLACMNRRWNVSKILLDKRVDIHVKDKNGRTALHYAVNSYHDLVQELCKRGADLSFTDNDGMNAFHHAITNFQMALFIHELNGDLVKQRLNNGDTSLHLAIKLDEDDRDDEFLVWLVEQGDVDFNVTNALNETPLILACKERCWDKKFFEILLSKNVDLNIRDIEGKSARDYIDESFPSHLLERFDELEEASPSK
ncbi:uncharacterized protein LOC135935876 [Cloeon dipterum]|uniref:uncharacterized protein LOC135935876 n=1 Tax=Cloeon dipterum TaxID=197152 RepID=UPI00321F8642